MKRDLSDAGEETEAVTEAILMKGMLSRAVNIRE